MAQGSSEHITYGIPTAQTTPGEGAIYAGMAAYEALYDLSTELGWSEGKRRHWVPSDRFAFHQWQEVESATPYAQAELDIAEGARFNGLLHTLHVALPYSEAERGWLHQAYYDLPVGPGRMNIIRRQEVELASSGLRQVVNGRDLLRRWWAWRRETDEFRGQGTLDLAREAFRGIYEAYYSPSPARDLPEPYKKLRGLD